MKISVACTTFDRISNHQTRLSAKSPNDFRIADLGCANLMPPISPLQALKVLASIAATIILAVAGWWASWLSTEVISIGRDLSSLTEIVRNQGDKIARIEQNLPVQIYAHADDLYSREFRTAIIAGEPVNKDGQTTKSVTIFDSLENKIKIYKFSINNQWDTMWLSSALWEIASNDINAFEFDYLESYRSKLGTDVDGKVLTKPLPIFVDTKHSILSSRDFSEIIKIMDSIVDIRGKIGSAEHQIDLVKGENNYRNIPDIIDKINASYRLDK